MEAIGGSGTTLNRRLKGPYWLGAMARNLLCLLMLCDVALCPAFCAWQCECSRTADDQATNGSACPYCANESSGTELPSCPGHPDCCRTCICKGAVISSPVQFEFDQHGYFVDLAWLPLLADHVRTMEVRRDISDLPPPLDFGGRFVRIWNCSWLC